MKSLRVILMAVGLLYGTSDLALAKTVSFTVNDVPGRWFDTGDDIAGTRSLAIIAPGDTVKFTQQVEARHTVTSLIWPSKAKPGPPMASSRMIASTVFDSVKVTMRSVSLAGRAATCF